jgi:hypothetical protein
MIAIHIKSCRLEPAFFSLLFPQGQFSLPSQTRDNQGMSTTTSHAIAPRTFVMIDFYLFDSQHTPIVEGFTPLYNYVARFDAPFSSCHTLDASLLCSPLRPLDLSLTLSAATSARHPRSYCTTSPHTLLRFHYTTSPSRPLRSRLGIPLLFSSYLPLFSSIP